MTYVLRFTFYNLFSPAGTLWGRGRLERLLLFLLVAATAVSLWGAASYRHHLNDDTYITLTYAKSLATGEGWRYNGGPEALGTTTPLFALVVAILGWLLSPLPIESLAVGFSTLCWVGTAWLLFLGHREFGLSQSAGAFLGSLLLLHGGWLLGSLGMEATFLLFGLTFSAWLAARGYALKAGLVSALLFLVRPEGVVMVPLVGGWLLCQRPAAWREVLPSFLLGAILPLLLWLLYAWSRFGSLLPNSVMAKLGQGAFWPGNSFVERLVGEWLPAHAANYGLSPILSLLWPLSLLGLLHLLWLRRALLLLVLWGALFLLGYALLGAPGYWWYMLPVLFVLQLLTGLGIVYLVEQPQGWMKRAGWVLGALFLTLACYHQAQVVLDNKGDPRAPTYLAVASWLRAHAAPADRVAFVEIGYLGYFTENPIVDLVGLVDPAFTDNGAQLALDRNFWQAEPEFFLYSSTFDFLLAPIVHDRRFASRYSPIAEFPSSRSAPMVLYRRILE